MRFVAFGLLLVLAMPTASAQIVPRPNWSEGDTWEFRASDGGSLVVRVAGRDELTNGSETISAWRLTSVTLLPGGRVAGSDTTWFRTTDLARLRETVGEGNASRTLSYDGGCVDTPFPLRARSSWTVSCTGADAASGARFTLSYNASVGGVENVTMPVGTFATLAVVRDLPTGEVREHWSSDACHWVMREGSGSALAVRSFQCRATGQDVRAPTVEPTPTPSPTADADRRGLPFPGPALALAVLAAFALATRLGGRKR